MVAPMCDHVDWAFWQPGPVCQGTARQHLHPACSLISDISWLYVLYSWGWSSHCTPSGGEARLFWEAPPNAVSCLSPQLRGSSSMSGGSATRHQGDMNCTRRLLGPPTLSGSQIRLPARTLPSCPLPVNSVALVGSHLGSWVAELVGTFLLGLI